MQEGNKSLGMFNNMLFGRENFILSPAAYVTEVGKRPTSRWLRFGRQQIYQEKNEAIRIAAKHNSSLKTFRYAIQKHLAMHQSDSTLQIPN